jgi:hypothetical protein
MAPVRHVVWLRDLGNVAHSPFRSKSWAIYRRVANGRDTQPGLLASVRLRRACKQVAVIDVQRSANPDSSGEQGRVHEQGGSEKSHHPGQ